MADEPRETGDGGSPKSKSPRKGSVKEVDTRLTAKVDEIAAQVAELTDVVTEIRGVTTIPVTARAGKDGDESVIALRVVIDQTGANIGAARPSNEDVQAAAERLGVTNDLLEDKLGHRLDALEERVAANEERLNEHDSRIRHNHDHIEGLTTAVDANGAEIAALDARIEEVRTEAREHTDDEVANLGSRMETTLTSFEDRIVNSFNAAIRRLTGGGFPTGKFLVWWAVLTIVVWIIGSVLTESTNLDGAQRAVVVLGGGAMFAGVFALLIATRGRQSIEELLLRPTRPSDNTRELPTTTPTPVESPAPDAPQPSSDGSGSGGGDSSSSDPSSPAPAQSS